ncbi:unnamed protein product [Cuscuta epithymum]|uniref:Uncharacterized protein n=1 Tax=Cuscuta epithymum TaxID=186058 RepID=A0AAV0GB62_9ASTE|nr:unnamed protein product [Cuscuta epithymum]
MVPRLQTDAVSRPPLPNNTLPPPATILIVDSSCPASLIWSRKKANRTTSSDCRPHQTIRKENSIARSYHLIHREKPRLNLSTKLVGTIAFKK